MNEAAKIVITLRGSLAPDIQDSNRVVHGVSSTPCSDNTAPPGNMVVARNYSSVKLRR